MPVNQRFQDIPALRALLAMFVNVCPLLVTIELLIKSICEHVDVPVSCHMTDDHMARTGSFKTLWLFLQKNCGAATILPFHYQ